MAADYLGEEIAMETAKEFARFSSEMTTLFDPAKKYQIVFGPCACKKSAGCVKTVLRAVPTDAAQAAIDLQNKSVDCVDAGSIMSLCSSDAETVS